MRIFGLLAIVIVLAIVMFQYRSQIQGTGYTENGGNLLNSDEIEKSLNESVSEHQKKLEESLNQSD